MQSDDILKQNKLLKQYIKTLEEENQSRNRQRIVLCSEIDRLLAQNADFQNKNHAKDNQSQTYQQLKKTYKELNKQMNAAKVHIAQLQNQLQNRDLRFKSLNMMEKPSQDNRTNEYLSKISELEQTVSKWERQYQSKVMQLETIQSQYQIFMTQKMENQKYTTQTANNSQKTIVELKQAHKNNQQLQNQCTRLLQLNKSLELRYAQVQSQAQTLQRQKNFINNKKEDMQEQLRRMSETVMNLQQNEQISRNSSSRISYQQKQIQTLSITINSLTKQLDSLKLQLRQKQNIINDLAHRMNAQHQVNTTHNIEAARIRSDYETELSNLRVQSQKSRRIIQQNNNLVQQLQNLQQSYSKLQLLYEESKKSNSTVRDVFGNEQKLWGLFDELKRQLTQVKQVNIKISNENIKMQKMMLEYIPHRDHVDSYRKMPNLQYNYDCSVEVGTDRNYKQNYTEGIIPAVHDHSNISDHNGIKPSQIKNGAFNNSKWQNLQRRINALKDENDELRKNLLN